MQMLSTGLRHYTWVIWHWLWLILLGTSISIGATYEISKHMTPVYQAIALIQVNSSSTSADYNSEVGKQYLAQSEALLVTNDDVLQEVTHKLPGLSLRQLKTAVSDSQLDTTSIIQVRAQADNPRLAADIANEVVNSFIQLQLEKTTARLQNIANQISQEMATAKANINIAQAQLVALQNAHASADKITHQEEILAGDQADYNSLLTNYQNAQQQVFQAPNPLSVAQAAAPPDKPVSPQVVLNTVIAALLGLLLMVILALLLDWIDATIKTPEDVLQLAMLEPLGSVPFTKSTPGSAVPLVVNNESVEEAFGGICTSFSMLSKGQRSLLVSSVRPGAGASTTAANLAIALAQSGVRVLLVDANLRKPSLHEVFHCPNTKGLASSLQYIPMFHAEQTNQLYTWLSQWSTPIPNLWFLPAGPLPTHPTTLLRRPELRMLIAWLLGQHQSISGHAIAGVVDIIIFDTCALGASTDTVALAHVTDGMVLVVEAGKERGETLNKVQTTFQRLGSPILGVVVNRQKAKHRTYFYADRYRRTTASIESASARSQIENGPMTVQTFVPETPPFLSTPRVIPLPGGGNGITGSLLPAPPRPLQSSASKSQFLAPPRMNDSGYHNNGNGPGR